MAKRLSLDEFTLNLASMKSYREGGCNKSAIEKMRRFVAKAVDVELTDNEKKYLLGYYVGGRKMRELAEENSVSVPNVSKTIKRAVNKLRTRSIYLDLR